MRKTEISDEDKKLIKAQQDNCPVVRFFRTKEQLAFSVGDYLIKVHKYEDGWETETISSISDQPKRFLCIHEDEYGIKYIRPLTSLGKELPYIIQLTESTEYTQYQLDPEYAEHIILSDGEEFDFSEKRKKDKAHRDKISRKNKTIAVRFNDVKQVDAFIKSLKPGDSLWHGYTIPGCAMSIPLIFVKFTTVAMQPRSDFGYRFQTLVAEFKRKDSQTSVVFKSEEFAGIIIMTTEPFKYETV